MSDEELFELLPAFMNTVKNKIISKNTLVNADIKPVYRGIKNEKPEKDDLLSHVELGLASEKCEKEVYYSCSVFEGEEGEQELLKKYKGNQRLINNCPYIAKGLIANNSGLRDNNNKSKHINWWIFDAYKNSVENDFESYIKVSELIED